MGNHIAETWCIRANTSCMHMLMVFVLSELSYCQLAMHDACHLEHRLLLEYACIHYAAARRDSS